MSAFLIAVAGCGSSGGDELFRGNGDPIQTGGQPAAVPDGGVRPDAAGTGGDMSAGTGGASSGGALNSGGFVETGGSVGAGGVASGTGGAPGTGGAEPACTPGFMEACQCPGGGPGARTCLEGALGECVCGACVEGAESACFCPDGSQGVAKCSAGRFSACTGCPVGPTGCPLGMPCTATSNNGSGSAYLCTAQGLPPACFVDADCATLGVPCTILPVVGGLCFKPCTPSWGSGGYGGNWNGR